MKRAEIQADTEVKNTRTLCSTRIVEALITAQTAAEDLKLRAETQKNEHKREMLRLKQELQEGKGRIKAQTLALKEQAKRLKAVDAELKRENETSIDEHDVRRAKAKLAKLKVEQELAAMQSKAKPKKPAKKAPKPAGAGAAPAEHKRDAHKDEDDAVVSSRSASPIDTAARRGAASLLFGASAGDEGDVEDADHEGDLDNRSNSPTP